MEVKEDVGMEGGGEGGRSGEGVGSSLMWKGDGVEILVYMNIHKLAQYPCCVTQIGFPCHERISYDLEIIAGQITRSRIFSPYVHYIVWVLL